MSEISRRKVLGASIASSVAVVAGKVSASEAGASGQSLKSNGNESMTLEEFRALNGPGAVPRLMREMDCDFLAQCHKKMKNEHGIWIPELVPIFEEIDARSHPDRS